MSDTPLRYRPHHFLCSLGFQGKGYSDGFVANMSGIIDGRLRAPGGDDVEIEVVGAADDICGPCPKRRGQLCESQSKIATLDARHARALGLFAGSRLTWGEAKRRIVKRVPPGALASLCAGCQWLELGLCESALDELHAEAADRVSRES
ncbi:DUF1284 domain-containing protein [Roseovarius sp.]|uniref:DUF1284 domain-containing protein n=1 Tax=Roseovarius sp. TaxID=1486281 RepID=UPI002623F8BD|nr:DUF1284 domain-containing protein [Roseovarius sp.]MDM8165466.1 DUF1284 domain-containing protein [Roseovarius sp.]